MNTIKPGSHIRYTQRTMHGESEYVAIIRDIRDNFIYVDPLYNSDMGRPSGQGRINLETIGTTEYGVMSFTVIKF